MSLLRLIPKDPLSCLRLMVALVMLAVLAPALVRLWCIKGLVRTIRIEGGSMAETLYGDHFRVTCGDCGITFRCDAEAFPADRRAVCPNCGFRDNELRDADLRRGDRVLVDTLPYLWSRPRRFDVVMLVNPNQQYEAEPNPYAVKRIAPPQLDIRHGDLYVGNKQLQKSLAELRQMAVLVHDNDFLPRSVPDPRRWSATAANGNWQISDDGFHFAAPAKTSGDDTQWLIYQHWRCDSSPRARTVSEQILDNDGYNQGYPRQLNDVNDILLVCTVKGSQGAFTMQLRDQGTVLAARFDASNSVVTLLENNRPVRACKISSVLGPEPARLEVALCEGRFLVGRNGRTLFERPYKLAFASRAKIASLPPIQIGAVGGNIDVTHVRLYRDIYYLDPAGTGRDWRDDSTAAFTGNLLVLGDNPPISIDSRHWHAGGLARSSILGRVILRGH